MNTIFCYAGYSEYGDVAGAKRLSRPPSWWCAPGTQCSMYRVSVVPCAWWCLPKATSSGCVTARCSASTTTSSSRRSNSSNSHHKCSGPCRRPWRQPYPPSRRTRQTDHWIRPCPACSSTVRRRVAVTTRLPPRCLRSPDRRGGPESANPKT